MAVNPSRLPKAQPLKPEPQHPVPVCHDGLDKSVSAGKCCSTPILVMNCLHFAFRASVAIFSSEGPELPLSPPMRGFPSVRKLSFFMEPSLRNRCLFQILCLFIFLYILPYLILWRLVCLFESLGSSTNFQKVFWRSCFTCRCIFDIAHSLLPKE